MVVETLNKEAHGDLTSPLLQRARLLKSPMNQLSQKKPLRSKSMVRTLSLILAITLYGTIIFVGSIDSMILFGINVDDDVHIHDQISVATKKKIDAKNKNVDPVYPEYNEDEALEHVFYSKVAFCTEHAIKSWSCGDMCNRAPIVGKDKIRYIREGERFKVQGYVAQIPVRRVDSGNSSGLEDSLNLSHNNDDDIKCMISFRGSLNIANWYADFLVKLRPWPVNELSGADWCPGCTAHYGFTEAYEELRANVHSAIVDLNCTRLVLAGHSLGAAIATIASFELRATMHYKVDATWTFGKPRIGNAEFVNNFEDAAAKQGISPPMWRVVHYHDPVPRAPPHFPGIHPVAHESLEIYYSNRASSEYHVCPHHGAMENNSKACMGGWPLYLPVNMDHVSYLNQSFAFKNFPDECKATE
mmetsp:Transcript_923/g.1953  ORF Transcript_923/g.1953 Transcript_923/m.1953 type:complete len:415 (-) Transcript_923:144-1388(-)|eukprot:CAMPEP_0197179654 /NCGR_PEP_ID=MMETSP1423-20130617/4528_1 /TAXON_ID=476441 /ORGANISM="Pseudo-nitzschia heimii, Strain UNC1101" /LENGTH=414 /DNA_ID=CAMNT_0042629589 /DNA_START=98 /DNA_END=1342 /DNA_ORIENTATION=+